MPPSCLPLLHGQQQLPFEVVIVDEARAVNEEEEEGVQALMQALGE